MTLKTISGTKTWLWYFSKDSPLNIVAYLKFLRKFCYWQKRVHLYPGEDLGNYPKIASCKLKFSLKFLFILKFTWMLHCSQ